MENVGTDLMKGQIYPQEHTDAVYIYSPTRFKMFVQLSIKIISKYITLYSVDISC